MNELTQSGSILFTSHLNQLLTHKRTEGNTQSLPTNRLSRPTKSPSYIENDLNVPIHTDIIARCCTTNRKTHDLHITAAWKSRKNKISTNICSSGIFVHEFYLFIISGALFLSSNKYVLIKII